MQRMALLPLFERIVARAIPLVAMTSTTQGTACCGDYVVSELRAIRALPEGWSYNPAGDGLFSADAAYSPRSSEEIPLDDCETLCGTPVEGCVLVAECEPLPPGMGSGGGSASSSSTSTSASSASSGGQGEGRCDPEDGAGPFAIRVVCDVTYGATCGRRPAGYRAPRRRVRPLDLGGFLAEACRLEAASIEAFAVLADELTHHRAPRPLVLEARVAMRDEIRHAQAMGALARRHGARPTSIPTRRKAAARPIVALAVENAREGCVRETYGALLACWQARQAEDPRVRAAFARIAPDEARHAELAHRVAAWADAQLDARERSRVARARTAAFERLARDLEAHPPLALASAAGLPPPHVAQHLLRSLRPHLEQRGGPRLS